MKYFKCENCGSELTKNADNTYSCAYCKRTYHDDSLEKAYDRVYQNLRGTVQGIVSEELLKQKIEQIATCRQALYKECNEQFVDNTEIERWAGEILKLSPKDAQANFYFLAAKKRWSELNKFMQKLNAREVSYLVDGFVDYLTNGQFVEKCVLCLSDLIDRAFDAGSEEYAVCHKKIVQADERERSGIFDVSLPRDVFVAYSSKDKEKAYELVEYLEKNGFTCFIAMRNLAKGVDAALKYNERLKKAMDSCRVFLLVSSSNSRARDCDAYRIEMQYVRDCDCKKANDYALANARYEEYLEKNRNRCKPRVEYLIEEYGSSPYEKIVKKFFGGLTWCRNLESVSDAVFELIEGVEFEESQADKLARERAEFEAQKAEMERQKAELARKEQEFSQRQTATAPTANANIDDLYKAFKERERAEEEERKRQVEEAERKRKEEEERKRQEELERQRKAEEERKRREEEERKRREEIERKRREEEERKHREEEDRKRREETQKYILKNFETVGGVLKKYIGCGGDVVIPEGITKVGAEAFKKCADITNVTISETVAVIEKDAFSYCDNLKSIRISSGVRLVEDYAFFGCKNLQEINVDERNEVYSSIDGSFYSKNRKRLIQYASGKLEREFFIPNGVKCIGFDAFHYCSNLEKVIVPTSVHVIEKHAFYKCPKLKIECVAKEVADLEEKWNPNNISVEWGVSIRYKDVDCFEIPQEEIEQVSDIKDFEIENGVLKKYNGKSHYVTIPEGVNVITKEAFSDVDNLVGITIPKSLVCVESKAFFSVYRLVEIYNKSCLNLSKNSSYGWLAYHAKNIRGEFDESKLWLDEKGYVFYTDNQTEILIAYLGEETNLILPQTANEIYEEAFRGNKKIQKVKMPDSVAKIDLMMFNGCESLTDVELSENITAIKGSVYNSLSFRYNEFSNGKYLGTKNNKYFALIKSKDYEIKSCEIHRDTRIVAGSAFSQCKNLREIEIPSLVEYIGPLAFCDCINLVKVQIPKSVSTIEGGAFKDCRSLTIYVETVTIPQGWKPSGVIAQSGWNPNGRPVILDFVRKQEEERKRQEEAERKSKEEAERKQAFRSQGFEVEKGVLKKYIGKNEIVVIPDGIKSIGENSFKDCKFLESVTIPSSVTEIGAWAFGFCSKLKEIKIGETVTSIGDNAFFGCSGLIAITIPNSVTSIGRDAFEGCSGLLAITIPNSVTSIAAYAFQGCEKLTVYAETKIKPENWFESYMFGKWNSDSRPVVWGYVGSESAEEIARKKIEEDKKRLAEEAREREKARQEEQKRIAEERQRKEREKKQGFQIENGVLVKYIGKGENVVIPNSVNAIGSNAFRDCVNLKSVVIPDSVVEIGASAFWGCKKLRDVTFSNSIKSIGNCAFHDCSSLVNVVLPNNLTRMEGSMFSGCTNLKNVQIPNSMDSIGNHVFLDCVNLTKIIIPMGVRMMANDVFKGCSNLTIYAEAEKKPDGWLQKLFGDKWNPDKRPVVWGYKDK